MQVAVMTAVIANGGAIPHPHVVKKIGSVTIMPGKPRQAGLKQRTIRLIRQGMYDAVHGEGGTAHRVAMEDVKVAGKTGTAQNPQGKAHGWFTAFAPFDDPKLCVAVFVEHGGSGGVEPADIAGAVFAEAKKRGLL